MEMPKPTIYIPFEVLPEGKTWKNGRSYRVKSVLRQVSTDEQGASFEVVDATSLEPGDAERRRHFNSDNGVIKGYA